jgi:hypothetical protein
MRTVELDDELAALLEKTQQPLAKATREAEKAASDSL